MEKKLKHKEIKQKKRSNGKSYTAVKKAITDVMETQEGRVGKKGSPDMAVDVLEKNVSEEQSVAQALVTEHIFRKTIEASIPAGIAGFDRDGIQIYVNRVFCEMVGWQEAELIGHSFPHPYWAAEDIQKLSLYKSVVGTKISDEGMELVFRRKNGKTFYGLVLNCMLTDSERNIVGYLMSVADISLQKNAEKALRKLSTKLIQTQESERKRVSQDLHDSIGGRLTGIKYGLEKILSDVKVYPEALQHSVQNAITIVQHTIEESQRISRNLHPSVLEDLGLLAAIRDLVREYRMLYGHIQINIRFGIDEQDIPGRLKILSYRFIQESLNNVAKHSQADKVKLAITKDEKHIYLIVEDNGCGFNVNHEMSEDDPSKHMGISNMRDRTELFGGSLIVRSGSEQGTVVKASWPLLGD